MKLDLMRRTHWMLALVAAFSFSGVSLAQDQDAEKKSSETSRKIEVEIVDRDGQTVNPRVMGLPRRQRQTPNAQGRVIVGGRGGGRASGGGGGRIVVGGQAVDGGQTGFRVANENGMITIVEADGSKREIDVSNARSVTVNQAVKSIMKDGQQQTQTFGRAIIIGPDGNRQEIELGGPVVGGNAGPGVFQFESVREPDKSKFMIGVNCEPVSETLRKQLDLESGGGLVVEQVSPDSPAAKAGLQQHDILMFAEDKILGKTSDLVESVQRAGEEETALSLTLIRGGKEVGAEVTPAERTESDFEMSEPIFGAFAFPGKDGEPQDFQFRKFGPGVIIGPEFKDNLDADDQDDLTEMHQEIRKMHDEIEKMHKMMQEQLGAGK